MSPPRRLRLAVVVSHPTQYYSPWFRWLQSREPLDLRAFYLWDFGAVRRRDPQFGAEVKWDVDLLSGYESEFVPNAARAPGTDHFFGLRNPSLTARLERWRPEALLLFGYPWSSHLRAILWARCHRVPLIFRGDSHFLGRPAPPWHRSLALRLLYAQFAAITYVGAANRAYFERLGVPPRRLFFAPHAVDQELFDPCRPDHQSTAAALRRSLGLASGTRTILFAGKLIPAKQPRELLQAFLELNPTVAALVFVGDGQERSALQDMAAAARPGSVHFLPWANQSEMPARYLMADIFALPSRGRYETWGLAVNEAMHLGRPALVSDRVGCQQDLVSDGVTGWVYASEGAAGLKQKLGEALRMEPGSLKQMGRNASARAADYGFAQAAAGLRAALDSLR